MNNNSSESLSNANSTIQQSLKEIASLLLLLHEHYLKVESGISEILASLTLLTYDTGLHLFNLIPLKLN